MPIILHFWDTLISITLNPAHPGLASISDAALQNLILESEAESEKVRVALLEGIVDKPKIRDKQLFVQINQALLIRLLDKLYAYRKNQEISDSLRDLYSTISGHLEQTLDFIEDFFSNYFDRNERVPASYLTLSLEELCRQLEVLQQALNSGDAIAPPLKNILIANFNKFCLQKVASATYNELVYQKELISELLTDNTLASEALIREVLFYFNFNDEDYIAYQFDQLKGLTEMLPTKKEKIAALRYEQKTINQLTTKLHCAVSVHMPSLKEQLNHWIEEEIRFLEREQVPEKPLKTEGEAEDKIHTSLSVAKLALLIRLMVIDKIITNRLVAPVLRMVVRTFTTLQKENMAFGSLETKYHNPDRGTINAVKEMLFRWINILSRL